LFKQSYPASEWIDAQKVTLKVKYTEAKKLGEAAQGYRNQMSILILTRTYKRTIIKPELRW
jgi:hypothetical protein